MLRSFLDLQFVFWLCLLTTKYRDKPVWRTLNLACQALIHPPIHIYTCTYIFYQYYIIYVWTSIRSMLRKFALWRIRICDSWKIPTEDLLNSFSSFCSNGKISSVNRALDCKKKSNTCIAKVYFHIQTNMYMDQNLHHFLSKVN